MRKEQVFKDSYKSESGKKRAPKIRAPFSTEMRFTGMKGQSGVSDAEWDRRQEALGIPIDLDVLEMHEIVFMEHFKNDWGQHFVWIPKDEKEHKPTNDFYWVEKKVEVEMKAVNLPKFGHIFRNISRSVKSAKAQGVTKDSFVVDLTGISKERVGKLVYQLSGYNREHPETKIRHLFIGSYGGSERVGKAQKIIPEGIYEISLI